MMVNTDRAKLQYMVGGLLYSPAMNTGLASKILKAAFPCLTSVAICLEDSICDESLEEAEKTLFRTLETLSEGGITKKDHPLLFVRIRTPKHMTHIYNFLKPFRDIITGYILPKYDLSNCEEYKQVILDINAESEVPVFIMPILESQVTADLRTRADTLVAIKKNLDSMKEYVLNVRVGGNDLSNLYGLRRGVDQNIYQIGVIRDILSDVINVFASDYIVSGPVWEYFGKDPDAPWATGLRSELELDRLNGFIGKTAIHPCQLPLIYESLKPKKSDYDDALRILGWNSSGLGVEKSMDGSRMNEVKCHQKWASSIAALGEIFGIREE